MRLLTVVVVVVSAVVVAVDHSRVAFSKVKEKLFVVPPPKLTQITHTQMHTQKNKNLCDFIFVF